jgi:hypothetical protein
VTIGVYDVDNHLFFPGSGPPSPAEYEPAQHMDPAVVADIAAWLASAPDARSALTVRKRTLVGRTCSRVSGSRTRRENHSAP